MHYDSAWKLRLSVQIQSDLILKRFKKRFTSLHNQDKKLFCFPNTSISSLSVPTGLKLCKTLSDFDVKELKGGFQRRPELIMEQGGESCQAAEEKALVQKWSRMTKKNRHIQEELVQKAMNLINVIKPISSKGVEIPQRRDDQIVLDIGCGDGTSTAPLLNMGYSCVGIDLNYKSLFRFQQHIKSNETFFPGHNQFGMNTDQSRNYLLKHDMWQRYSLSNSFCLADVVRWDLRCGLPFTSNSFDLAISISFLQWLFYGKKERQLNLFFSSLKSVLCRNASAVIQFYPRNPSQLEDAVRHASNYFQGVVVGDYPHMDRGRKLFLVLFA